MVPLALNASLKVVLKPTCLTERFPLVQLFFEDNIDDAKYCGRLYGLGSGSSQPQNGISSSGQEETNNKHWPSAPSRQVEYALVLKPDQQQDKTKYRSLIFLPGDCDMDSWRQRLLHSFLFRRFYWVYGHIFTRLFKQFVLLSAFFNSVGPAPVPNCDSDQILQFTLLLQQGFRFLS